MKLKYLFSIFIFSLLFFTNCSNNKVSKINWNGELISNMQQINYVSWKDGNQYFTMEQDSITVSLAGFEVDKTIYLLVSITNNHLKPVTFFTNNCSFTFGEENQKIVLSPVKAKNIAENHYSLFNTVLQSAGGISRLFLNIPVDQLLKVGIDDSNNAGSISQEYHDEKYNMSKKIFMGNHTLFPSSNYSGFLVFEHEKIQELKSENFELTINAGSKFLVSGYFND